MSELNDKIVKIFNTLAMFKSLEDDVWRAKTYSRVAETVEGLRVDIKDVEDIYELPGVGTSSGGKIEEIIETGTSSRYEFYMKKYPGLVELTRVDGIGPKKAYKYWKEYGVRSLQDLKAKLTSGEIKNTAKISESLEHLLNQTSARLPRLDVLPFVEKILLEVRSWPNVQKAEFAGSMRREMPTVRDVDILVAVSNEHMAKIQSKFLELATKNGHEVLAQGDSKSRIRLPIAGKQKIQVDLLTILPEHYGAALNYFTGSRDHNIRIRSWAKQHGLTVNEYGVWNSKEVRLDRPGLDEYALFDCLKLIYIDPTKRDGSKLIYRDSSA